MTKTNNDHQTFLQFFPMTLFASVSSMSSLSYAWGYLGFAPWIKPCLSMLSVALFISLSIIYLLKWWKYPEMVKNDFMDPVASNLFGIFFISLLLVSNQVYAWNNLLALVIWVTGTLLTFLFAYMMITRWITKQQNALHALPVWLIPIVGLLDIPLTGHIFPIEIVHEVCLLFFAVGLLFTFIVTTMIFQRLIFQEGMASTLMPTLLLLSVPFTLLFSDYEQITQRQDLAATILFYTGFFLVLLLGRRILLCLMHVQFTITWWATSFPLAAITASSFRYASHTTLPAIKAIPFILLAVSVLVFLMLCLQTAHYMIANFLVKACPKPRKRLSLHDLLKLQ